MTGSFMDNERSVKALLWTVAIIWGLNVVMIKFLVGYFPPITLAAVRIGAATLFLVAVALANKQFFDQLKHISGKAWLLIVGAGASGIFLHQTTVSFGLQTANASTGSLILGLNPLVTGVLAYLFLRESLSWNRIVGVIVGFIGVFIVVTGDSLVYSSSSMFHFGKGELFVFISMFAYVISGLLIKKAAETVPILPLTTLMHIAGSVLLAVSSVIEVQVKGGISWPGNPFVWSVLLFSGWVATALCGIWWNQGIRKIGAGRATMFLNGMPVSSLVFAVLLLGERFSSIHFIGFATVFLGIWLGTMSRKQVSIPIQHSIPHK